MHDAHKEEPGLVARIVAAMRLLRVSIVAVLVVLILAFIYFAVNRDMSFFIVPSKSMVPTLYPQDHLLTLRPTSYFRGDVVVLADPDAPKDFIVKRIVALPGDTVQVHDGLLHVNGQPVREPYILEPMKYGMRSIRVGDDEVFVLGDDRNGSHDGHTWKRGIPASSIAGKVYCVYLPVGRWRTIPSGRNAFHAVR
jgi:signal peptidase I